jgi:hypothetical protein
MSLFNFLFQGSPPPSITQNTTTQQGLPDWYQSLMIANAGQASQAASTGYQPFPGPQVAPFQQAQNQAFSQVQQNQGDYQPFVQAANTALSGVAGGFNSNQFNQYMNPYTSQVTNSIQQLGDQNLLQNVIPGVNDQFTAAGQAGSTRNANFDALAIQQGQMGISNAQSQALQSGFQGSMQNYLQGQSTAAGAGTALGALGQADQQMGLTDAAALNQIGTQQQGQVQQNYNAAQQNFTNQQNYPYQQVSFMNNIIRGLPTPTTSTGSYAGPYVAYQPSPLATAAGVAAVGSATSGTGTNSGLGNLISGL